MYFWIYYLICVAYCFWRFILRYKKSSHDGVIGNTPGLDSIIVLILGWILAPIDIIVTSYQKLKEKTT